jgi:TRAP-type C4-dicarboxylate transport system substrate-binding protein
VQKYYALVPILWNGDVFLANEEMFNSLSEEQQKIVRDASIVAIKTLNRTFVEEDEKALRKLEQSDMQIWKPTPEEIIPFIEDSKAVWDENLPKFSPEMRELALEIQRRGEKYEPDCGLTLSK